MTPEQFAYWLQGFVELSGDAPTPEQWQSIKEHLSLVFNKVTPPISVVPHGSKPGDYSFRDLGQAPIEYKVTC